MPRSSAALRRARTGLGVRFNHPLLRVIAHRLAISVPVFVVATGLSFVLLSLTPGSAADAILSYTAPPSEYVKVRHELGLDQPVYLQYWHWASHAVRGDLGRSLLGGGSGEEVAKMIRERLPVTFSLFAGALVLMAIVGVALGVFSAVRGGAASRIVDALSLIGLALPGFWIGAMLIEAFAVRIRLFPVLGYVPLTQSPALWLRALVLPVVALSIGGIAGIAKNTRDAMLDALASEHVRMAWANGVPARWIYFVYAFKNAAMRMVTIFGLLTIGLLLGGTILAEIVFGLPGVGNLLVTAAEAHDFPVVQGIVAFFIVVAVVINLVVDLVYGLLDPRVRTT